MTKSGLIILVIVLLISGISASQNDDLYKDSKPASTNIREQEFPRVDTQSRVIFHVEAPDAEKVQIDILKVYDMKKDKDGACNVTTDPLPPGFHYYYLMIDGVLFC